MNVLDRTGMSVRVLLVTRFRELSMKVAAANRGALAIVHVAWHGAQDYLLKHRLDADTLMPAWHGAIARKTREGILLGHKQRAAQMTLNSIEDAILSTDSAGLITFLNPIAERLVGWTYAEAAGRHLLEVFQVIEASTRERVMPRMESKAQLARATAHRKPADSGEWQSAARGASVLRRRAA